MRGDVTTSKGSALIGVKRKRFSEDHINRKENTMFPVIDPNWIVTLGYNLCDIVGIVYIMPILM